MALQNGLGVFGPQIFIPEEEYVYPPHPFRSPHIPYEVASAQALLPGLAWWAEDFLQWVGPLSQGTLGGWTLTENHAGAGQGLALSTLAIDEGGALLFTTGATANDNEVLTLNGQAVHYEANIAGVQWKEMGFICTVALSDFINMKAIMGLAVPVTTPFTTLPTDGFFFSKTNAADTTFSFHVRKAGVSTIITGIDQTALANNSYAIYGFFVNEAGSINICWGSRLSNISVVSVVLSSNANIPTAQLTPLFANQTTAGASKIMRLASAGFWKQLIVRA